MLREMQTIAQIQTQYGGGGAQRVTLTLADALEAHGYASCAIALRQAGEYAKSARVDVFDLNAGRGGLLGVLLTIRSLRGLVKRRNIALVHAHSRGSLVAAVLASLGIRRRPQFWFTWHIPDAVLTERGVKRWILLWALNHCDLVWADSQAIVDELKREPRLKTDCRVFVNCVAEADASEASTKSEAVILWMARIAPTKDPEILIRAAQRLKQEGMRFRMVIAGGAVPELAWYENRVKELVTKLGLQEEIEMPGWIEDMHTVLNRCNIGVQTSHYEGLSLTLLEQMMAGLALVATDVGDTSRAIGSAECGLLIPAKDENALYSALRRLIMDDSLRTRLGRKARENALAYFSARAAVERVAPELMRLGIVPAQPSVACSAT